MFSLAMDLGYGLEVGFGLGGLGGVAHGPTVQIARSPTSIALSSGSPTANITFTALDANGVATGQRVYGVSSDPTITSILPDAPWTATKVTTGTTAVLYGQLTDPNASDEPFFNGGTDTEHYVDDMSKYNGMTATDIGGAGSSLTGTRFVPDPSYWIRDVTNTTQNQVVAGAAAGRVGLRNTFPASALDSSAWDTYLLPEISASRMVVAEMLIAFTSAMTILDDFSHKFFLQQPGSGYDAYGGFQVCTHNSVPYAWTGPNPVVHTLFQVYSTRGFTDNVQAYPDGHDQGTQPVGPYLYQLVDGRQTRFKFVYKDHTPGVGTLTVSGGVATFSNSQTGLIVNGRRIRLNLIDPNLGYSAFVVSALAGDGLSCTLTGAPDGSYGFAPSLDGYVRVYLNGTKVIDVSQATVGVVPAGAVKQWCGQQAVDALNVGYATRGPIFFGKDNTSNAPDFTEDLLYFRYWSRP